MLESTQSGGRTAFISRADRDSIQRTLFTEVDRPGFSCRRIEKLLFGMNRLYCRRGLLSLSLFEHWARGMFWKMTDDGLTPVDWTIFVEHLRCYGRNPATLGLILTLGHSCGLFEDISGLQDFCLQGEMAFAEDHRDNDEDFSLVRVFSLEEEEYEEDGDDYHNYNAVESFRMARRLIDDL
jgi:hypothetical protein